MKLDCYVFSGWNPSIRAASSKLDWMNGRPEILADSRSPSPIAHSYGWEILSPCGFEAVWNGGDRPEDVLITLDNSDDHVVAPEAIFGRASLTFHIQALLGTEEGVDLWCGGAPNEAKDAIAPLSGIIEPDSYPYNFMVNWCFTRPNHPVRFEAGEPIAFVFPVIRQLLEAEQPTIKSIEENPELKRQFLDWSQSANISSPQMDVGQNGLPSAKWEKFYGRGNAPDDGAGRAPDQTEVRASGPIVAEPTSLSATPSTSDAAAARAKWATDAKLRLAAMNRDSDDIFGKRGISSEEFFLKHYVTNWPVVLRGEMDEWPAHGLWTPEYLREKIGDAPVEVQTRRRSNKDYERHMDAHRESLAFGAFLDRVLDASQSNDCYLTAYNARNNGQALAPLQADLGSIKGILDPNSEAMFWIGGAGSFTPLHHDLTNNLLLQVCGRKKLILVAPEYREKLYNSYHVYSEISDLSEPGITEKYPLLNEVTIHEIIIEPGDALFIPIGWWHQVTALDFSVSMTHTNFIWPNDFYADFPQ